MSNDVNILGDSYLHFLDGLRDQQWPSLRL